MFCLCSKFGMAQRPGAPHEGTRNNKEVRRPVSRVLSPRDGLRPHAEDGHSSGTPVTGRLARPTRTAAWKPACRPLAGYRPYLVLLPVGFALPPPSPEARCALTAPFRPCRHPLPGRPAVWFLWHCPWGRPRRALPGTAFPWSPDFPPPAREGHNTCARRAAIRPPDPPRGKRSYGARSRTAQPGMRARRCSSRLRVSGSALPSIRRGRKWRWNAVTAAAVSAS